MFTGIVRAVGQISSVQRIGGDVRLVLDPQSLGTTQFELGDSVSVNGVCLTVISTGDGALGFDVSSESLDLTTLGTIEAGSRVNLEPAATPSTALGGHIVSGHVDTMATVVSRQDDARSVRMHFEVPQDFARYIATKGSVCLDGVSLTVNGVDGATFDVNVVPHTLEVTVIDAYQPGTKVNLEVDVVSRYVERLLEARKPL
jgi:riboflavin synthase